MFKDTVLVRAHSAHEVPCGISLELVERSLDSLRSQNAVMLPVECLIAILSLPLAVDLTDVECLSRALPCLVDFSPSPSFDCFNTVTL